MLVQYCNPKRFMTILCVDDSNTNLMKKNPKRSIETDAEQKHDLKKITRKITRLL